MLKRRPSRPPFLFSGRASEKDPGVRWLALPHSWTFLTVLYARAIFFTARVDILHARVNILSARVKIHHARVKFLSDCAIFFTVRAIFDTARVNILSGRVISGSARENIFLDCVKNLYAIVKSVHANGKLFHARVIVSAARVIVAHARVIAASAREKSFRERAIAIFACLAYSHVPTKRQYPGHAEAKPDRVLSKTHLTF